MANMQTILNYCTVFVEMDIDNDMLMTPALLLFYQSKNSFLQGKKVICVYLIVLRHLTIRNNNTKIFLMIFAYDRRKKGL